LTGDKWFPLTNSQWFGSMGSMTTLEIKIKDLGISYYRIAELMGQNGNQYSFKWAKKIRGITPFNKEEYGKLIKAIEDYVKKPINKRDISVDVLTLRVR